MNKWGRERVPFLFLIDFELKRPKLWRLSDIKPEELLFDINGFSNATKQTVGKRVHLKKYPITFEAYQQKFNLVKQHLHYGNSFLVNLTCKSRIELNLSLKEIFYLSKAKYKLCLEDKFVVFSPETFIQINNEGIISSFPMKGTIDADRPNAASKILSDQKEMAEHVTIVDLIRNDLSKVADQVEVPKFRYIDEINTHEKNILQVSSVVQGKLRNDWFAHIGEILFTLLPAGSVSGAPKPSTLEIIAMAEKNDRGYYTGIAGIFDGEKFDSGVLIRFIEKDGSQFFYRSGGGITAQSEEIAEYKEMIDKIYVPLNREHQTI
ncbi:MAG TPA: aminodeoxychorismate synthase component I [Cyclobacteriaceae bacterium]|nr:aminodeoxychorismate synthase component I [Cyclobacteriaceae bacterium]